MTNVTSLLPRLFVRAWMRDHWRYDRYYQLIHANLHFVAQDIVRDIDFPRLHARHPNHGVSLNSVLDALIAERLAITDIAVAIYPDLTA
jgi:hypothetical protein